MFTRQHYKAIAAIIKGVAQMHEPVIEAEQPIKYGVTVTKRSISEKLADYFAKDNERFDREKFLEACGL